MAYSGQQGDYIWFVVPTPITSLTRLSLQCHAGLRLYITAFDSGPISPSVEELAEGWSQSGRSMVSPPLREDLDIPNDQYDEWYILDGLSSWESEPEVFVNYGMFSLVSPEETYKTFENAADRHGLDYLVAVQERFWNQLTRINPVTYIAIGDNDVVVSRNRAFIQELQRVV